MAVQKRVARILEFEWLNNRSTLCIILLDSSLLKRNIKILIIKKKNVLYSMTLSATERPTEHVTQISPTTMIDDLIRTLPLTSWLDFFFPCHTPWMTLDESTEWPFKVCALSSQLNVQKKKRSTFSHDLSKLRLISHVTWPPHKKTIIFVAATVKMCNKC